MPGVSARRRTPSTEEAAVDWKLELVTIPVTDVDRAKAFYTEKAGFTPTTTTTSATSSASCS